MICPDIRTSEFKELHADLPAVVIPEIVHISEKLKEAIIRKLPEDGKVRLEEGPYQNYPLDKSWATRWCHAALFADRGEIDQHIDEAGDTMGLIIINEGHSLCIDGHEWEMPEGTLYHINSDLEHGTRCQDSGALLVIVTLDFGWKKPLPTGVTYLEVAEAILEKINGQ